MTFDNKCRDCRHRTGEGVLALRSLKTGHGPHPTTVRIISKMSMAQIAECRFYKQVRHAAVA